MNAHLQSPDQNASTQDWLAWLEELQAMPDSGPVKKAVTHARRTLESRRKCEKKTPHGVHGHHVEAFA